MFSRLQRSIQDLKILVMVLINIDTKFEISEIVDKDWWNI
jgi:hypothetical protein